MSKRFRAIKQEFKEERGVKFNNRDVRNHLHRMERNGKLTDRNDGRIKFPWHKYPKEIPPIQGEFYYIKRSDGSFNWDCYDEDGWDNETGVKAWAYMPDPWKELKDGED